jgi:cysteine desulfuration protein SufE
MRDPPTDAGATIADAAEELAAEFALLPDWEDRYAHVIDLGRTLAPLAASERNEATRVRGCVSQVWLVTDRRPDAPDRLHFRGDSDAHIVRGLIAVLLRLFNDRTPAEILEAEPQRVFARLGLADSLTPQRSNGVVAMIERIRREALSAHGGKLGESQLQGDLG